MTYTVKTDKSAAKELDKLPRDTQIIFNENPEWGNRSIRDILKEPYNLPENVDVKKLAEVGNYWRISIGEYRCLYFIKKRENEVVITHYFRRKGKKDYDETALRAREKRGGYDGLENAYGPGVYQKALPSELRPPLEPTQLVRAIVEDVPGLAPYLEHIPVHFSGGPQNGNAVYLTDDFMDLTLGEQNFDFAEAVGLVYLNQHGGIHALLEQGRRNQVDMWNPDDLLFQVDDAKDCFAKCFAVYMLDEAALYELSPKWFAIVESLIV